MKKVLILGVAAVQSDAIKTLKDLGYQTFAIAMKKDGPGADIADYFEEINILDIEKVVEYIKTNNIDAVYSTGSDLAIPVASKISEMLEMPHFVTENTARVTNNKDLMRQTLGNDFEGNIPFQILENINEELKLKYPFIMKPTDSQGQRGVNVINDFKEFQREFEATKKYSRTGKVIIEYYVQGPEISVNGYVVNGEIKYLTASDRETWENYIGLIHKHIVPAQVLNKESYNKLFDIMNRLVKKLEINNGPVYAQVKIENNMPYIIEVTPRLDGCHMWNVLEKYENVNLMKLTFEHLLENDLSELDKFKKNTEVFELEFICQEPNTLANYSEYKDAIRNSIDSYLYYTENDVVRTINGKYEKIGYFINKR